MRANLPPVERFVGGRLPEKKPSSGAINLRFGHLATATAGKSSPRRRIVDLFFGWCFGNLKMAELGLLNLCGEVGDLSKSIAIFRSDRR
jgi:hypothetical protein